MTPFPKYQNNIKYHDSTVTEAPTSKNQNTWKIPRRSARIKKQIENTFPIETQNKFTPLATDITSMKLPNKFLNENNIHDNPPITKPSRKPTNNDFSIIFNISEKQLTQSEKSVLEKGLNFCPETPGYNKPQLMDDLFWFCRNLRLREFFYEDTRTKNNSNIADYYEKQERTDMSKQLKNRSFHPPQDHCDKLNQYISSIKNGIINLCKNKHINHQQNITIEEKLAIKNLQSNQNIIIHSADKGGKIVIMNRNDYKEECEKQLSNSTFYEQADISMLQKQNTAIKNEIINMKTNNYISEKEYKFLSKHFNSSRTPIFYGLPKIHKHFEKFPPLRPIVSGFNCISANLSEYLDSYLKFQAQNCKSYIRDTSDFLLKLKSLTTIPSNSILVTMDVTSLYTNIDHEEGAEACYRKLETRKNKTIPSITLKKCILLILKSNIFQFCQKFFLQRMGTAMGTPMAANYANIFMDSFETSLLNEFYKKTGKKPLIWLRFIDDIFFIWTDGEESLKEFLEFCQKYSQKRNMKSVIKFEISQSTKTVNFLDVCITFNQQTLSTTVFSKPTDAHIYLNPKSCHPEHMIKNIPKSQFLRLRKICSNTCDYIKKSNEYINFFTKQGYEISKLKVVAKEMLSKARDELLLQNQKTKNEKTIMVTTWHPALKQLPQILREKYNQLIENDNYLKKVFPEKPIIAYRKKKSIKNYIVRTDINHSTELKEPKKTIPCSSCRKTCHLISDLDTIINIHNNKTISNFDGGNCRTANIVYAAICKIHGDIYIGQTGEELKDRFNKHRYDAKHRPENNELTSHIHKYQHDFDKDIEILILKSNLHHKHEREFWEDKFICLLGTKAPTGLNVELKHYGRELYEAFADLKM